MTEVKKFFADAFHHLGSNRGIPVIDVRFIRMPDYATRSECAQDSLCALIGHL